jgi:methylmalonyl-CoA/ethylmalonyl-CoA epimerase
MRGRIHHVGIVVADLADAGRFLEDVLGFHLEATQKLPEAQIDAGFFAIGDGAQVELLQLGDPEARAQRLGEGNVGRLDHIAIEVDDVDAVREELRPAGVRMQSEEPRRTSLARSYFTRPETTGGVVYQFLDRRLT